MPIAIRSAYLFGKKALNYWPFFLIPVMFWLTEHYRLYINVSSSLPQKYWIVGLNKLPKRGDYICFSAAHEVAAENGFSKDVTLTKQVLAVAGDLITRQQRDFYINGKYIARAKTHSLKGERLNVGPTGVLKAGQYYVGGLHQDSFDSRYEKMGWITDSQIIGVAYPLWPE